ncbi:MAG TPA: hypothetical protein VLH87_05375, partial [Pyrinomonadaceae bacterium]|nr:hypothetical protein [Pyrinomonadaceae bacterium]
SKIESEPGLAEIEQGTVVGDGDGSTVGDGNIVGVGRTVGVGNIVGVGRTVGVGNTVGDGDGDAPGEGDATGDGDAAGDGVAFGSGMSCTGVGLTVTPGSQPSSKISELIVTSPEPVMMTLTEPDKSFENATLSSFAVRPRQSKSIVEIGMLKVTPVSVVKFCVLTVPEPLKSMVIA